MLKLWAAKSKTEPIDYNAVAIQQALRLQRSECVNPLAVKPSDFSDEYDRRPITVNIPELLIPPATRLFNVRASIFERARAFTKSDEAITAPVPKPLSNYDSIRRAIMRRVNRLGDRLSNLSANAMDSLMRRYGLDV